MQSLVMKHNNNLVTVLQKIAEETSSDITSMQRLIRTHKERLEKFGNIEFEEIEVKGKTGSTKKKQYYLNEQQSYLFITFLKNTKSVLDFKEILIKEFFEMKQKLNQAQLSQPHEVKQLQETILQQNAIIAGLQNQLPDTKSSTKLEADNKHLKRVLIQFSDRYHNIVQNADNQIEAMRKELLAMTNVFQTLPNLENDGKNLNTDTKAKHSHW